MALYGGNLPVVRFPFDFSWMVARFLDAVRPDVVCLVELEVWPNLALACRNRGIPLVVVNGRLSEASFRRYRRVRPFVGSIFESLSAVGAQTEAYAERFRSLGVPAARIAVTDNMKWDTVRIVDEVPGAQELGVAMGIDPDRPLVVAGSTGPGEEALLLSGKPAGVQLMLVPRKPERFEEVARLASGIVRRSQRPDGPSGAPARNDLYLLDTMGELTKAYSLADLAVVGRSFVPLGGSDPIEAIALGKPTLIGPHHENFGEVVTALHGSGGIRISQRPMEDVRLLLGDPEARRRMAEAGRDVIRSRQGATERNARLVHGLLQSFPGGAGSDGEGEGSPPNRSTTGEGGHRKSRKRSGSLKRWMIPAALLYGVAGYTTTALRIVPSQEAAPPSFPLPAWGGRILSGVFSVHTGRSHDAVGTREEVARAAADAGLDFVVIGDHPPDDRRPGWTFWEPVFMDGVLLEGGQELRSPVAGKVLAVGVDTTYKQWTGDYGAFVEMLEGYRATSFVVHGRGPRGSERWVWESVEGVHGWEVLDISEFARHRLRSLWGPYHVGTLLAGIPVGLGDEALRHLMREGFDTPAAAAYDSFRVGNRLTATAGANVHPKIRLGPLLLPPYGPFFRSLITHVAVPSPLPPSPGEASGLLMEGLRSGDAFVSVGDRERARDFRAGAVDGKGGVVWMGSADAFTEGMFLRAGFARDPAGRLLYRVLRNGLESGWYRGEELEWPLPGPGIYRVEVYRYWARVGGLFLRLRPWILSNPLEVSSSGGAGDLPREAQLPLR
jgi:3-deoxy-D-manno-octulosonic-acid transferase